MSYQGAKSGPLGTIVKTATNAYKKFTSPSNSMADRGKEIAMKVYGTMDPVGRTPTITKASSYSPGYSSPTYRPPDYQVMSQAQAIQKAREQHEPLRVMARTNAGVVNQQQQNILAQKLNAQGQLGDGEYKQGLVNLSGQLQGSLDNIDMDANARVSDLAQNFIQQDREERARRVAEAMQAFQAERGVFENDRNFDRGALESDRNFDRGVLESDRTHDYRSSRDKIEDARANENLNLQKRIGISNMLGQDTVTGRPTFDRVQFDKNYGLAADDNSRQWANLDLQRWNARDDSARGWAGLEARQQEGTQSSAQDMVKARNNTVTNAHKYFDGLKYDARGEGYTMGVKTKSQMKSQFNTLFDSFAQEPDPYAAFQKEKAELYKDMPHTGPLLANALETALSPYSMGK